MNPTASDTASSPEALRTQALQYVADHNTVSLATVGAEGPWATTVFYASVDFTLYFLSEPKTQHVRNVIESPQIGATINEDYRDWRQIKGIQMSATCKEVTGKVELARALATYVKKYPFVAQFLSPGQLLRGMQVAGKALDVRLYRVSPTRLLFIDNERGFSNRQEIPLEAKR
jgi:uncharacterized protein